MTNGDEITNGGGVTNGGGGVANGGGGVTNGGGGLTNGGGGVANGGGGVVNGVSETEVNFYAECGRRCDASFLYLLRQSETRLHHLTSLLDFLTAATQQLLQMNDKEVIEK